MKKLSSISPSVIPPFEPCAICNDGWLMVPNGKYGSQPVYRCPCWKAHQQRVADALKQMKGK